MAITKSAKKAIRVSARKRVFNLRRLRMMRSLIKELNTLTKAGDKVAAQEKYTVVQKAIDKATKKGVIKQNNASRKKSRLVKKIKQIG